MTSYALTYVGVKGAPISAAEHDANIHNLDDRVTAIETDPPSAVSIASISVSGGAMTVTLTDASTLGPFTLPVIAHPLRGAWAPATNYAKYDWFYDNGTAYEVLRDHTSSSTFDPNANDGAGHDYYEVVMPAATLAGLPDVAYPTGGPAEGDVLVFRGTHWTPETQRAVAGTVTTDTATLAASMNGGYLRCTNAAGCSITVPSDETLAGLSGDPIPPDFEVTFRQVTAGPIQFVPETTTGSIVTIHPARYGYDLSTPYEGAVVTLKRVGADEYDLIGPPGALVT